MKLNEILLEGMYDKLVGKINKDLFKTIKSAVGVSGTTENPKKYKGYEVRKDPIPMTGIADLFNSETKSITVGEYSDEVSGVDVDVELKLAVTNDGVTPGKFYIDGSAESDEDYSTIEVQIAIHPDDGNRIFSKIQPILRDLIRHEVEHLTHGRKSSSAKQSKVMRGDLAMRRKIKDNPKLFYKYYLLPKEVDANIHGLYAKAKTMKKPYQMVVDNYLDSLVNNDIITPANRKLIYKTWKNRIPKIGGIPTLK